LKSVAATVEWKSIALGWKAMGAIITQHPESVTNPEAKVVRIPLGVNLRILPLTPSATKRLSAIDTN
jgi:hypothetical protein